MAGKESNAKLEKTIMAPIRRNVLFQLNGNWCIVISVAIAVDHFDGRDFAVVFTGMRDTALSLASESVLVRVRSAFTVSAGVLTSSVSCYEAVSSDGHAVMENSLVVSMEINGTMYQGVLFAQPSIRLPTVGGH
ncbi:unnamed protein product [Soboliphyme baturini]|uniref:REKLES domain-containing protein n=1 Tax=Soboliphyme baturini TaxID=241478 RepID=A0A183IBS3_9BILA|nr:unnamed protein product [Soboliphyme baturini]